MSKELEVTPGPWHVEAHSRGAGHINVTGPRLLPRPRFGPVAAAYTNLAGPMDDSCVAEMAANARLIAEAGTVLHETGLTPRQLAEQRAELLEAVRRVASEMMDYVDQDADPEFDTMALWAHSLAAAIGNATQQRKESGA